MKILTFSLLLLSLGCFAQDFVKLDSIEAISYVEDLQDSVIVEKVRYGYNNQGKLNYYSVKKYDFDKAKLVSADSNRVFYNEFGELDEIRFFNWRENKWVYTEKESFICDNNLIKAKVTYDVLGNEYLKTFYNYDSKERLIIELTIKSIGDTLNWVNSTLDSTFYGDANGAVENPKREYLWDIASEVWIKPRYAGGTNIDSLNSEGKVSSSYLNINRPESGAYYQYSYNEKGDLIQSIDFDYDTTTSIWIPIVNNTFQHDYSFQVPVLKVLKLVSDEYNSSSAIFRIGDGVLTSSNNFTWNEDNNTWINTSRSKLYYSKDVFVGDLAFDIETEVVLYPTISKGLFYIKDYYKSYKLELYTTSGVLVKDNVVDRGSVHLVGLSDGMYIYSLVGEHGVVNKGRIIIRN